MPRSSNDPLAKCPAEAKEKKGLSHMGLPCPATSCSQGPPGQWHQGPRDALGAGGGMEVGTIPVQEVGYSEEKSVDSTRRC